MARIESARARAEASEAAAEADRAAYYREVADLVDEVGGPAAAKLLDVTTQRVYQLRSKARR